MDSTRPPALSRRTLLLGGLAATPFVLTGCGWRRDGERHARPRVDGNGDVILTPSLVSLGAQSGARCDAALDATARIDDASRDRVHTANAVFANQDLGKVIAIDGAGDDRGTHSTRIAEVVSTEEVRLDHAATNAVSDAYVLWGTDDTDAIQDALDALDGTGGTITLPGVALCTGSISLRRRAGVSLAGVNGLNVAFPLGDGATRPAQVQLPASGLVYVGDGDDAFIDASESDGFQLRDLGILSFHSGHRGVVLDLHGGDDVDRRTYYPRVTSCSIGVVAVRTSAVPALVELGRVWHPAFAESVFLGGNYQFQLTNGGYTNGASVTSCTFVDYTTAVWLNPSEGLSFSSCSVHRAFDPKLEHQSLRLIDSDGTRDWDGVNIEGCWFSDVDEGAPAHAYVTANVGGTAGMGGLRLAGCRIALSSTSTLVKVASNDFRGISIVGNSISLAPGAELVDFGGAVGTRGEVRANTLAGTARLTTAPNDFGAFEI